MGNKALEQLTELGNEIKNLKRNIAHQVDQQDKEIKEHGGTLTKTRKRLDGLEEKYEKAVDGLRNEFGELEEKHQERMDALEAKLAARPDLSNLAQVASAGQRYVESEDWKRFSAAKGQTTLDQIAIGGVFGPQQKAAAMLAASGIEQKTLTGTSAIQAVLSRDLVQEIYALPRLRRDHIRNYMNVIKTDKSSMAYTQETGFVNNAAGKAEGVAAAISTMSLVEKTATAKTIAHGMVLTREQAKDGPTVVSHIDGRLINGIYHQEDIDLIKGDGTNFVEGITNVTGVQPFTRGQAGDNYLDNLRRAATQIRLIEKLPASANLAMVSVEDWEVMELLKDDNKRYLWVSVAMGGEKNAFKMPILDTTAMDEGAFIVGDWFAGADYYDLEEAFVQIFNQHASFALEGKLLMLGMARTYVCWKYPEFFVSGTFGQVGSGSGS